MLNRDLKHMLLFEAFSGKSISKTIKFLDSKGKKNSIRFIESLRKLKNLYDYPIDKISDDFLEYLPVKEALKIKVPENHIYNNKWEIWNLTFWFSLENGYLGYTGTGNKNDDLYKSTQFTEDELEIIEEKLGINKGKLVKVEDYTKLNHLDKVILYLNEDLDKNKLTFGTIWKYDSEIWVIQDSENGDSPYYSEDRLGNDWRDFGRYSWIIYDQGSIKKDHLKLHKYIESDESLHVEVSEKSQNDPKNWILPIRSNGHLTTWRNSYSSCDDSILDNADFAIVFYFDDFMNPDIAPFYEKPSEIKVEREKSRIGATSFLTDEEIRNKNIENYISKSISKYNIEDGKFDINKLKNVILGILKPISILSCKRGYISAILDLSDKIYSLIHSIDRNSDIEYSHKRLLDLLSDLKKESIYRMHKWNKTLIDLKRKINSENIDEGRKKNCIYILDSIEELSKKLYDRASMQELDTVEDIKIFYYKLRSIRTAMDDDDKFYINDYIMTILRSIMEGNLDKAYGYLYNESRDEDVERLKGVLSNIEKMINSYFK